MFKGGDPIDNKEKIQMQVKALTAQYGAARLNLKQTGKVINLSPNHVAHWLAMHGVTCQKTGTRKYVAIPDIVEAIYTDRVSPVD